MHHPILVSLVSFELKVLVLGFLRDHFICKSLRGSFSSVGYHLRGCSRVGYLLRSVKGAWSQKSKRVNWNHNPIVLLEGLVWKLELVEPQAQD